MGDTSRSTRRQLSFRSHCCTLCQKQHSRLSSPAEWKNVKAREYVLSHEQLSSTSLVCHPCRGDITKVLANPGMVPRWKKGASTVVKQVVRDCCVFECSSPSFVSTTLGTIDQIKPVVYSAGIVHAWGRHTNTNTTVSEPLPPPL